MQKWQWRVIGILIFIALIIIVHHSPIAQYFSLEQLKANRDWLKLYVRSHFFAAQYIYLITYIFVTAFAVPVAAALTIFGGFLFGAMHGMVLTNIGATTGATLAFLGARYLVGTAIHEKYARQLRAFDENISQYGAYYLLSLRFLVVVPFFLLNILAGLTKVPLMTFIWTTMIGIMPASLIFSYAGKELADINSVQDIFSWELLIAFAGLALLAFLPLLVQKLEMAKK
ncbi:MAG: VTT domain-containing protein [Candidatus Babeliales bacterium]